MTNEISGTAALDALDLAPCGIILLDSAGAIVWLNAQAREILGADATQLSGQQASSYASLSWLFGEQDIGYVAASASRPARWLRGWREKLRGDGQAIYLIDVSEQQQLRAEHARLTQQLDELDTRDSLTGLANRQALQQHLEPLVSRSRRYGNPLSIIRVQTEEPAQLDRRYGASTGQSVMVTISRELRDQLRWTDIVGRLDGGDFLLILPETGRDAAAVLAGKIAARLAAVTLTDAGGEAVTLPLRYGVTGWEKGDDSRRLLERVAQLAEQADSAANHIAVG